MTDAQRKDFTAKVVAAIRRKDAGAETQIMHELDAVIMHELLMGMGFVQHDTDPLRGGAEYYHPKHQITFRPEKDQGLPGLAEALINGGMARQKLETLEVITQAAKKLGFKF